MSHKPNFTAQLTNKAAVEEAAASVGCVHTRGREKGTGSIRAMLEEIGQGEILLMFHPFDDPETMLLAADQICKTAESISEDPMDGARSLITALAAALKNAAKTKKAADDYFLAHQFDD